MSRQKSFPLRLDEVIYERLRLKAASEGVSMNTLIQKVLDKEMPPSDPFGRPNSFIEADLMRPITFEDSAKSLPKIVNEAISALQEETGRLIYWLAFNQEQMELLISLQKQIIEPHDNYLYDDASLNLVNHDKKLLILQSRKAQLESLIKLVHKFKKIADNVEKVRRRRDKELLRSLALITCRVEWIKQDFDGIEREYKKEKC